MTAERVSQNRGGSTPGVRRVARSRRTPKVTPEAYAEFIRQIELKRIWLDSARVANFRGPESPKDGSLHISTGAEWEKIDDGFRARYRTEMEIAEDDTALAEVEVVFGLDFTSRTEMTDDLFEVFEEVNLPVNTWPYVREFLATTMGRMNWAPFALPALKRGTRASSSRPAAAEEDHTTEAEKEVPVRRRASKAPARAVAKAKQQG